MTYPFSRFITLSSVLVIVGLCWLWLNQPEHLVARNAVLERVHHFDVEALKARQTVATSAVVARARPLFTPGRKPFVPAPHPPPISTPPQISVVEVAPEVTQPIVVVPEIPSVPQVLLPPPVQPPVIEETAAIPPPARFEDAGLQLKGIMINRNSRKALLNSSQDPVGRWLQVGDSIADWQIVSIEESRISMKSGDSVGSLQLYVDKSAN
jgi:hypothetical protein